MAPALTEPISHRQSKISSPAQASSPRPIIGDLTDQTVTQNSSTTIAQNHLQIQTNGSAIDTYSTTIKDTTQTNQLTDHTEKIIHLNHTQQQQQQQQQQQLSQPPQQFENFETDFIEQTSDGPCLGPLFATHMDQSTNDQINCDYNQQQQQQEQQQLQQQQQQQQNEQQVPDQSSADCDLYNALANTTNSQSNNQMADCGNLAAIQTTVEELLAHAQTPEFQQQLQNELLQQHHQSIDQVQNQNFDLQSMDLLMTTSNDDHTSQASSSNAINSTNSPMSSQIQMQIQNNFLKDSAEMEQMLGDLNGGDIDFMQVLKCIESAPAGENLGDLAGDLSLFNDVDVMNIGLDDVVGANPPRESRAQDMLVEIERKRERMIRECEFMMRRLRKIQARHMGRHISEEAAGLFDYTQQLIKQKERETKSISTMTPINQLHGDKHKLNSATSMKLLLKRIEQAAINQQSSSTSAKILMSHANSTTIDHHANSLNNSSTISSGSTSSSKPSVITCVPAFDANGTQQLKQCSGLLSTQLSIIQKSIDSDATASSSGGESADEGIVYNNPTQRPLSIAKRAAYRWARDRAKIASRWTWLLAQISDLEYRIRQHQELYYLLRKKNGQVSFEDGEPIPSSSSSSTDVGSVNGCRNLLTNLTDNGLNKKPETEEIETNGSARTRAFKASAFKKRKLLQSTNLHKISRRAARPCTIKCGCRWPVHPCLLCTGRTDPTAPRDLPDMLSTQESVALLDPCFHPILSFPEDVAQNIHIESTLRQPEWQTRVARVSTKAIIKGALAMQKANERDAHRNNTNTSPATNRKNNDSLYQESKSKKMSPKKFKLGLGKKLKSRNNSSSGVNSSLINNNMSTVPVERKRRGKKPKNLPPIPGKQRKNKSRKNSHMSATSSDHHDMDIGSPNSSISRSKNPSPTPTGYGYHRLHSNQRHNKNAYDIDNIVIPSNMSTTIEVLSYKEIPTPKWRVIPDDNVLKPPVASQKPVQEEQKSVLDEQSLNDAPEEDISNEAYVQRHERGLNDERKKFLTFLKFPYSTRSRANRRTDSQADSSGANTPDPMSPAPSTPAAAVGTNEESAPPTPQSVDPSAESDAKTVNNNTTTSGNGNGIIQNPLPPIAEPKNSRRRTVSFRKAIDPREELLRRSTTPDVKDITPPYEPLAFPLPVDTLEQMIQCMPTSYKDIINECIDQVTSDAAGNKIDEIVPEKNLSTFVSNRETENLSELSMLAEDSDETESVPDEDPNDPEFEPTPAKRMLKGP